jgi:hypothetical protein
MKFILRSAENQDTGELGLLDSRITNEDVYEPLTYFVGLAHDCLEHFAFDSVADEIEAHAAMYWIRYEGGWTNRYGGMVTSTSFGEEWTSLCHGLLDDSFIPKPPRTIKLDEDTERAISSFIEHGSKEAKMDDHSDEVVNAIAEVYRAYFRRGYRKAIKRFKGHENYDIANLFSNLTDELEKIMKHVEVEGQEFHVDVDMKTLEITWKQIELDVQQ